jgi:hypothetical protein
MARVTRIDQARVAAQANADFFREPFVVFTDTSGNVRVERQSTGPRNLGCELEVFEPKTERYYAFMDTCEVKYLGEFIDIHAAFEVQPANSCWVFGADDLEKFLRSAVEARAQEEP